MRQIALSTMWGIGRFPDLDEFFCSGSQAGFDRFELNHAVDSAMLEPVNLNGHRIASLHEPCPADMTPAILAERDWLISSLDDEARRMAWLRCAAQSISRPTSVQRQWWCIQVA